MLWKITHFTILFDYFCNSAFFQSLTSPRARAIENFHVFQICKRAANTDIYDKIGVSEILVEQAFTDYKTTSNLSQKVRGSNPFGRTIIFKGFRDFGRNTDLEKSSISHHAGNFTRNRKPFVFPFA
jgi:hypothetical protein